MTCHKCQQELDLADPLGRRIISGDYWCADCAEHKLWMPPASHPLVQIDAELKRLGHELV
jgi:hypothetical protein